MNSKYNKWLLGAALTGIAAVLIDALVLEKYFFQTKWYSIGNKKSTKKLKLVLLTDLHFKYNLWPSYKKLAHKINKLKPDLIFIAGDTLNTQGKLQPVKDFFSLIDRTIPKVAIPGNHDHKSAIGIHKLEKVFNQHNCTLLINESKSYELQGQRIMVTGVDDFIEGDACFETAVSDVGKEEHHFLLVHSPLQQEPCLHEIERLNEERTPDNRLNIQYIFAGHNHGGQVTFLGFVPVLPKKSGGYINGWYNRESPYLYVSKGFGTTAVPFRFGARSELTILNYGV